MLEEISKNYELTLISSPNLSEAELNSLEEEIEGKIKELEGKVLSAHGRSPAGRDKVELAYFVKKHNTANFSVLNFSLSSEKIQELSNALKRESRLLRHLISHPLIKKNSKITKKKKSGASKTVRKIDKKPEEKVGAQKNKARKDSAKGKIKMEEIDKKLDEILEG